MNKKKTILSALAAGLTLSTVLAACGGDDNEGTSSNGEGGEGSDFKVAMVTDTGGVDDKSFNQSAWEGLQKFGADNNLTENEGFKYLQSSKQADYQPNLQQLARDNFNLIYGIGFLMGEDIQKVAEQFPDNNFALVDMVVDAPNVASITFKEQEGSFLVGVVAGLTTKTDKVGFIGGVESDLIKKFENGYKAGVMAVNPDATIDVKYAEDFNSAEKGTAISSGMYGAGSDIIYHAAGGTGVGVFTEAKNRKKNGEDVWVIGVDRDQYEEGLPENVTLTSMVKRVDTATYEVSKLAMEDKFPAGEIVEFSLKDDGVGIAETSSENVAADVLTKVEEYRTQLIDGDITAPATDAEFEEFMKTVK
ncbi:MULTISPECIES: BMP family protein [unclassified Exiguobacterium]|uniref:BMP family lipoprotein n=1 Tax=unclassified Exiguobacterium TaxID=2644629 RepID=UPI00103EEEF9|nr:MULTISPECIES: BMP family ABC transporter substrate-binding protein [unclassified Exiguobacterium]TCI37731.1 BMP family ABC transporter substrate-binding protein [Exiguobacterium sp. SH4S7]TCI65914.1 BMP family ABC transporter substrate-binding protein [Exiguobacterium sp. SH0S2]TCI81034.1 BMP family ABC transporter substrate-binding protein [Exiguobacterium sp. SH0S1]